VTAGLTQSYLMRSVSGPWRSRGSGTRVLLFTLESALGGVSVVLMAALAHWSSWLLPVAALLYLLIVGSHGVAVRLLAGGHCFVHGGGGAKLVFGAPAGARPGPPIRQARSRWWCLCWWLSP